MNNIKAENPIGIFDSGIGGLTVANAITSALPNEKIIYFGDTAHLPYGDKSPESIKHYAIKICSFLLENNCKTIVIACNTASSVAFQTIRKCVDDKIDVVNVIDPVANYVARKYPGKKIGVIGTKGTINSRIYARKITKLNNKVKITSLATPLLAPMIEEGFFNNYISRTIINSYLSKKNFSDINALILACTHYPLIKAEVEDYYNDQVKIIDSAEIVARIVETRLSQSNLLRQSKKPKHAFYISDYTEAFEKSTNIFFKGNIHLDEVRIWE